MNSDSKYLIEQQAKLPLLSPTKSTQPLKVPRVDRITTIPNIYKVFTETQKIGNNYSGQKIIRTDGFANTLYNLPNHGSFNTSSGIINIIDQNTSEMQFFRKSREANRFKSREILKSIEETTKSSSDFKKMPKAQSTQMTPKNQKNQFVYSEFPLSVPIDVSKKVYSVNNQKGLSVANLLCVSTLSNDLSKNSEITISKCSRGVICLSSDPKLHRRQHSQAKNTNSTDRNISSQVPQTQITKEIQTTKEEVDKEIEESSPQMKTAKTIKGLILNKTGALKRQNYKNNKYKSTIPEDQEQFYQFEETKEIQRQEINLNN